MSASVPMFETQALQVPCPDLSEDQEHHLRRPRASTTTTLDNPTAGTASAIPPDKTASLRDSVETSHVQRPEGQRSVSNLRPSALRAILGTAPAVILHVAAGTSLAASATIPPLRGSSKVPAPWWIAMYATWGAAFGIFLTLELRRLPDWAQRRLLMGLFIFSGLNLTGSLVQGGDSMLEGVVSWIPLAMTASLLLVPMLMMFWGVRGAVEVAGIY